MPYVNHDFVSSIYLPARGHGVRVSARPTLVRDYGRSACDGDPMEA